jgi:predicted nucleotidyltransferase
MSRTIPRLMEVRAILEQSGVTGRAVVFGSRATNRAKPYSDLDVLIQGDAPIPLPALARLEALLEESDLPYHVDIVDAQRASPGFLDAIQADCRPLEDFLPE